MQKQRAEWSHWAKKLDTWGLKDITAWFLDAFSPLAFLGAQLLYTGQPFLRFSANDQRVELLAQTLEDHDELSAFVTFLREERSA